jgi:hypothetical protein
MTQEIIVFFLIGIGAACRWRRARHGVRRDSTSLLLSFGITPA